MNFNSLVWYSSLAIGEEKNKFVADFLNRSCEIINEEIKEINFSYQFFQHFRQSTLEYYNNRKD